jgi:hypothetical protein
MVWVDVSITRTGGRTTQQVMASLAQRGLLDHHQTLILGGSAGYQHSAAEFSGLLAAMVRTCTNDHTDHAKGGEPLRVAVQVTDDGAQEFWERWLPSIRRLRAHGAGSCCRVLVTTRIRDPLSHYLSSYVWATAGKPNLGTQISRPRVQLGANGRAFAKLPRPSFEKWAPRNLQTHMLARGGTKYVTEEQTGRVGDPPREVLRPEYDSMLAALETDFDLVVPLENFDDGLRLVASRLGIPLNDSGLYYDRISPRQRFYGGGLAGVTRESAAALACPNMTRCAELVRKIAPLDAELYARARGIFRGIGQPATDATASTFSTPWPNTGWVSASGATQRCAPRRLRHGPESAATFSRVLRMHPEACHTSRDSPGGERGRSLAAEIAAFAGVCSALTAASVDSTVNVREDGHSGITNVVQSSNSASIRSHGPCELVAGDATEYAEPSDDACDEVRAVFYFASPPSRGSPTKRVSLPAIPPSPCNVAVVDNTTDFGEASGWTLRRITRWPFPRDAPRSAHYLKVIAPLIFRNARVVLAGDVKCAGSASGFPCAMMRPGPANTIRVAKNRWYKSSSVEGEFVRTWKHMRVRRMPASVFRQITEQLCAYEDEEYDMAPIHVLPDTFCMGWRSNLLSRSFSCRFGNEVATRSMREQLSFDHALHQQQHVFPHSGRLTDPLNISWWPMTVVKDHGNAECLDSSKPRDVTNVLPRPTPPLTAQATQLVPARSDPPLLGLTAAHTNGGLAHPSGRPAELLHALCVTGLQRSFAEIGASIRSRVFQFLQATASVVEIRRFGVQPRNDSWENVKRELGPFDTLDLQTSCRPPGAPLPAFFTCTRGSRVHRQDSCTASFVQMMCDLRRCDAMMRAFEEAVPGRRPFDFVTWMRLDVVWELDLAPALPLPAIAANRPHAIWLPQMNSQRGGMCDKFAFGNRRGMSAYLNRFDLIDLNFSSVARSSSYEAARWNCVDIGPKQVCNPRPFADTSGMCTKRAGCMISLSSERFVSFALFRANVTVVRMKPWAFCKFGDSQHAWPGCTARVRARKRCMSLECPSWMSGGCACNADRLCKPKSWYCTNVENATTLVLSPIAVP